MFGDMGPPNFMDAFRSVLQHHNLDFINDTTKIIKEKQQEEIISAQNEVSVFTTNKPFGLDFKKSIPENIQYIKKIL